MTLKPNSKKILDIIAGQPGINQTDAYRQVHPSAGDNSARANSYKLMKKPEAQIYLQKHIDKAKQTVVSLLDSDKDDIKLRSADSILDRELGKATQRVEVQSQQVSININMTQGQEPTDTDNVAQ